MKLSHRPGDTADIPRKRKHVYAHCKPVSPLMRFCRSALFPRAACTPCTSGTVRASHSSGDVHRLGVPTGMKLGTGEKCWRFANV